MKILKLIGIALLTFSFTNCGCAKFDKNPPFTITEANYNNWIGGQPGVSGTKIMIGYTSTKNIEFDSIFFINKATKVELYSNENKTFLIGHYSTSNTEKHNLVMDADTRKEINNKPPHQEKIPFELKENEAVISYKEDGKTNYFKIENVKKTKSDFYQ